MSRVNIVTPCCGTPFDIITCNEGYGHLARDVPDEIICSGKGCYNSWDRRGVASEYNRERENV